MENFGCPTALWYLLVTENSKSMK